MELNEAEARFSTIDPILKCILDLTGCRVKLEETVKMSDLLISENVSGLEQRVSDKSTSDYVIYHITVNKAVKILLVEAKTDMSLSRDSVAQVIGYFMASEVDNMDSLPPLGIILTRAIDIFPIQKQKGSLC